MSASRSLPSVVYFEYCGFLLYHTEPSVKKFDVVDCDFLTVPLMLAVPFFFFKYCFKIIVGFIARLGGFVIICQPIADEFAEFISFS